MSEFKVIPTTERLILSILSESRQRELYGLEILKASKKRLVRGTLYTTLQRMQDKGLIGAATDNDTDEAAGINRKKYFITGLGQRALAAAEFVDTGRLPELNWI